MKLTSRTYADLQLGADLFQRGATDRAKVAFETILEREPDNPEALANLALIEARVTEDYRRALRLLEDARKALQETKGITWYQVMYAIAANHMHVGLKEREAKEREFFKLAYTAARVLTLEAASTVHADPKGRSRLLAFLTKTLEPSVVVLLAGVTLELTEEEPSSRRPPPADRTFLFELPEDATKVNPADLVSYVENLVAPPGRLPYRVEYNLACFYARVGVFVDKRTKGWEKRREAYRVSALDHLERALERSHGRLKELLSWATTDPSLKSLHGHREFTNLISRFSPTSAVAPQSVWSALRWIGPRHGAALTKLGLTSVQDVIDSTRSPRQRRALAQQLGIERRTLERWRRLLELVQLGLDAKNANLLEKTGVTSLAELARMDTEEVIGVLRDANLAEAITERLPSRTTVSSWIRRARRLSRRPFAGR